MNSVADIELVTVRTEGHATSSEGDGEDDDGEVVPVNAFFTVKFEDGSISEFVMIDEGSITDDNGDLVQDRDPKMNQYLETLGQRPYMSSFWDEYSDKDGATVTKYDGHGRILAHQFENGWTPPNPDDRF